ncbi:GNAT family N-acetyltransferase [Rhodopseudomonas sp. P2A-2r]|uniref:GNAT family N-acetyltransferase n=1 Tax=unclassified Rhodopseudomonas TaxID=2638247 RepID=UPI002233FED7|nr:GNAT family N-acetyltransferase [Rhodopseudomonas sp. P2A-2r]UZE51621.1 GNAT family N-acetyltransferase [Rhodopseudomonas sp. P2A-2r]
MEQQIRRAEIGDANDISHVIISALRETNAKDYKPEIIARLELGFSPSAVQQLIAQRDILVGLLDHRIVGTAGLDGDKVRTVFVTPDVQGRGVGRRLMQAVEAIARERQIPLLRLNSSISAESFYARLGYTVVREVFYGDERTIVMERLLSAAAD